jgi:hypothetical protein
MLLGSGKLLVRIESAPQEPVSSRNPSKTVEPGVASAALARSCLTAGLVQALRVVTS